MKKKQIIISAVSLILVCTVFATGIAALILNSSSRLEERTEQTDDSTEESTDESTQDIHVPPIKDNPEDSASDKPVLDVTDMKRDPNPIVTDSTVEYGTKEADANVE